MSLREQFFSFDDALAAKGVPPLTRWWREGVGAWLDAYQRGHVLELWACVGRGAAKSSVLYKLALFFALFGDFKVPPGEIHFAIVLSRLKEEASKGVAIIDRWLTLLGIKHRLAGDVIELAEVPRGIRVVAASVAATSGWRAFFVGRDERSKWGADGVENLDADEVDTSAVAMTATHRYAPTITTGSAWGKFGSFYDAITGGTDSNRVVLGPAPTWIAAPHITEADCRRKERDPRRFAREYACEFQATECAAFDGDDIDAAFAHADDHDAGRADRIMVADPSSGRKDSFAWGVVGWDLPVTGPQLLRFDLVDGIGGSFFRTISAADLVAKIAKVASENGVRSVIADQRDAYTLDSHFARHRLAYTPIAWTSESKPRGVETARRWLRERTIALPKHEQLRRELISFEERLTPAGSYTFGARGSGHDDFVALLITAALAHEAGEFPLPRSSRRIAPRNDPGAGFRPQGSGLGGHFAGCPGRGF